VVIAKAWHHAQGDTTVGAIIPSVHSASVFPADPAGFVLRFFRSILRERRQKMTFVSTAQPVSRVHAWLLGDWGLHVITFVKGRLCPTLSTTELTGELQPEFAKGVELPLATLRFVQDERVVGAEFNKVEKNRFSPFHRFAGECIVGNRFVTPIATRHVTVVVLNAHRLSNLLCFPTTTFFLPCYSHNRGVVFR